MEARDYLSGHPLTLTDALERRELLLAIATLVGNEGWRGEFFEPISRLIPLLSDIEVCALWGGVLWSLPLDVDHTLTCENLFAERISTALSSRESWERYRLLKQAAGDELNSRPTGDLEFLVRDERARRTSRRYGTEVASEVIAFQM